MRRVLDAACGLACLAACAACSPNNVTVRGGARGTPDGRERPDPIPTHGGLPTPDWPRDAPRTPTTGRSAVVSPRDRLVCRNSGASGGWMAIAYLATPADCPSRPGTPADDRNAGYGGAIITELSAYSLGSELSICADQRVPAAWESGPATGDSDGRCPGAGRDGRSAVRRIRRVR